VLTVEDVDVIRRVLKYVWRVSWVSIVVLAIAFCVMTIYLSDVISEYSPQTNTAQADAIVVLGAGSFRVIERRAAHAYELWSDDIADNIICTGGDTPHRSRAESEHCQTLMMRWGVPAENIFVETHSRSTEENAIFAAPIMANNGWTSAVIVSDYYHLWRAELIFTRTWDENWSVHTSSAQLTQRDIPDRVRSRVILREVLATYWYVGKGLLGLPYTDFPAS
jgi:uncharacterized SAM-binding protein YcdF (DUF218 family)